MAHEKWKEWLQLSVYGELSESQQIELDDHIGNCKTCYDHLEQLKRFHHLFCISAPPRTDQSTLREVRHNLHTVLQYEMARPGLRERIGEWSEVFKGKFAFIGIPTFRSAMTGFSFACIGIFIGLSYNEPKNNLILPSLSAENIDILSRGEVDISNVRFLDLDPADGSIEFVFEAIRPIQMKGSLEDPLVQRVLSFAVVNEQNPGVRLKAINAAGSFSQTSPDSEIKNALITAVKTDPNPEVRKEAFYALIKYPYDQSIGGAMVHVLTNDDNAALRIEAINMLQARAKGNIPLANDIGEVLKTRMQSDSNNYIRTRARTVLEDIENL